MFGMKGLRQQVLGSGIVVSAVPLILICSIVFIQNKQTINLAEMGIHDQAVQNMKAQTERVYQMCLLARDEVTNTISEGNKVKLLNELKKIVVGQSGYIYIYYRARVKNRGCMFCQRKENVMER